MLIMNGLPVTFMMMKYKCLIKLLTFITKQMATQNHVRVKNKNTHSCVEMMCLTVL